MPKAHNGSTLAMQDLIKHCHKVYSRHLTHAAAGNVSIRLDDELVITASGLSLDEIDAENLVRVTIDHGIVKPPNTFTPSSELKIHTEIYKSNPNIQAIIHAHPTKATALGISGQSLEEPVLSEMVMFLGPVPLVPYVLPGSDSLANTLYPLFRRYNAVILANHGVITTGSSIREAFHRLECLEVLAETVIISNILGTRHALSRQDVSAIFDHPATSTDALLFKA